MAPLLLLLAQALTWAHGGTLPAACTPVDIFIKTSAPVSVNVCTSTNTWTELGSGGGSSVPAGSILLVASGTCPAGFVEETALDGRTLVGTTAAAGNVGTTGGSDTITSVLNHTHTVSITDPGHTHVERILNSGTAGTVGVQGASAASNANASNSPTASGTTGISATTANPAGGVASIDNRSAFTRVIFCRKT